MSQDNLGQIKENIAPNYSVRGKNFLQSEEWRKFQEATGKRTFHIEQGGFSVNIIEHTLPVIGNYFYIPRKSILGLEPSVTDLAKKEKAGWIRFDSENEEILKLIKKNTNYRIAKAPHDMQSREIFVFDITKSEEQLLNEMKSKTRYNINLAQKKGVKILVTRNSQLDTKKENYIEEFIKLVNLTAKRKGIRFHPGDYYRKMIESLPNDILSLYIAEYNGKVIAANLIVFYKNTAIYLHGATDDEYRNVMAPYLLQWQAILDAKKRGCKFYDFGGVMTHNVERITHSDWAGITKFKLGFSQTAKPIEFPGSYDIITDRKRYYLYRIIQKIKCLIK